MESLSRGRASHTNIRQRVHRALASKKSAPRAPPEGNARDTCQKAYGVKVRTRSVGERREVWPSTPDRLAKSALDDRGCSALALTAGCKHHRDNDA